MTWEKFDVECEGCKPALCDTKKDANGNLLLGQQLPDDHPLVAAMLEVWARTTLDEREHYHRVCCQNSRNPKDLEVFQALALRMQEAMQKVKME